MTETFQSRIPTLSEAELRGYLQHRQAYKAEAVEAALAELLRRGCAVSDEDRRHIQGELAQRDTDRRAREGRWLLPLLGPVPARRRPRLHLLTAAILALGLGGALVIQRTAAVRPPNPLGYEPEDTKRYLRQLEMVGGKANVVAVQFRQWFDGLWQGPQLATTVATLTGVLAAGFWLVASHGLGSLEGQAAEVPPRDPSRPRG
jgi:hypothetical protein